MVRRTEDRFAAELGEYPALATLVSDLREVVPLAALEGLPLADAVQLSRDIFQLATTHPGQGLHHLNTLFSLVQSDNLYLVELTLGTLSEVFTSICPLYRVQPSSLERKVRKEELANSEFEQGLLAMYKKYLQVCGVLLAQKAGPEVHKLKLTVIRNLGLLLERLSHFNLSQKVVGMLVSKAFSGNRQLRELASQFIGRVLAQDRLSSAGSKLEIMACIATTIAKPNNIYRYSEQLAAAVNSTEVDIQYLRDEEEEEKTKKREKKEMHKHNHKQHGHGPGNHADQQWIKEREAARKKAERQTRRELAQGEAVSSKEAAKKNLQLLEKLYYIQIKVLKHQSPLPTLQQALDGILKYAHLVNYKLLDEIIKELISKGASLREYHKAHGLKVDLFVTRVSVAFTLLSLIEGPASMFKLHPGPASHCCYLVLLDLREHRLSAEVARNGRLRTSLLSFIHAAFFKARQLSKELVASFIYQLVHLSLQMGEEQLAILRVVKQLFEAYPRTRPMLEPDNEGFGLNSFNPKVENPLMNNAHNTSVYEELSQLERRGGEVKKLAGWLLGSVRSAVS